MIFCMIVIVSNSQHTALTAGEPANHDLEPAVPVYSRPQDVLLTDVFLDLQRIAGRSLFLKCEGFNFAGSAKLVTARSMIEGAERTGRLKPGSVIVESSSGNLGVALAVVCADRGYPLVCVLDPLSSSNSRRIIESLGAKILLVDKTDQFGGYLGTRIETVRKLCFSDRRYVWLDQYTNDDNWRGHYLRTAVAIDKEFPGLGHLIVGTGTGGTLMGCARYFKERSPSTRIIAVDVAGSVTFGGAPSRRLLPGLGTSRRPAIVDVGYVDKVVVVGERETISMCRRLARHGYLLGASTGSVVSGAIKALKEVPGSETAVAISSDLGERYLPTAYDDAWVDSHYPGLCQELGAGRHLRQAGAGTR
jgi:N-(2-amino-2-carboxyethyl)-L-glutamate synthase